MTTTANDLIATAQHDQTTGAVTYWKLSGDVDLAQLAQAWEAEGLDPAWLPAAVSATTALQRAVNEQRSADTLVRKDPKGGWSLVIESKVNQELVYKVAARFWLDTNEAVQCDRPVGPRAQAIIAAYTQARSVLSTQDSSNWLVALARRLGAVLLRETGGIYFVPRPCIAKFHAAKRAVAAATAHTVYEIPAIQSAEVTMAVFDALQKEVLDEIADMEKDLANDTVRGSTLVARLNHCREVIAKVQGFERLLGKPVGDAVAQLTDLKDRFAKAATAKATRIELLEIDDPLSADQEAAIKRDAAAQSARIAARKAALMAPNPLAAAPAPVVVPAEPNRFSGLEVE